MSLLQLNLTPSRKDLRWFAGLWWPLMCAGIGFMLMRKFHAPTAATYVWSGGGLLAILGLMSPAIIRPFYLTLLRITFPIGFVVSHVVLGAMYFLVLTPIGYLLRLFHDPMERQLKPAAASYWVSHPAAESSRYFRQL